VSVHTHEGTRPTFGCPGCIEDRDLGKQFDPVRKLDAWSRATCDVEECDERAVIVALSDEFSIDVHLCRDHALSTIYNDDGEVAR